MQISRTMLNLTVITSLLAALSGCASSDLIDVRPGSEKVAVADGEQVAGCQSKGKITVNVLAKVGFVNRSVESVDANLLQLAKNGAVDMGGDTVVKGERPEFGRRTFAIYKCRP
jgi:hypothetical protein